MRVNVIDEYGINEWIDERMSVTRGNLRRGARIRALRGELQVTMGEFMAELRAMPRKKGIPVSDYSISTKERGFTPMSQEMEDYWIRAIKMASKREGPKARRRKLNQQRKSYLKDAA